MTNTQPKVMNLATAPGRRHLHDVLALCSLLRLPCSRRPPHYPSPPMALCRFLFSRARRSTDLNTYHTVSLARGASPQAASVERRRGAPKQAIGDDLELKRDHGTCEVKQGQRHAGSKPAKRMAQSAARIPHPELTLARELFLGAPSQPPPHLTINKTAASCKDFERESVAGKCR